MATLSSPTISWNMVYICWAHCCRLVWQHKFMHKAIQRIASPATLYSVFQCLCLSWSKPPTQPSFKHEKSKCSSMRVTGLWFEQMFNEKIQQQCCLSCTYNYLTYNHDLNGILWNVLRLFIYLFIFSLSKCYICVQHNTLMREKKKKFHLKFLNIRNLFTCHLPIEADGRPPLSQFLLEDSAC